MAEPTPPDSGGGTGLNKRVLGGIPLWGVYIIVIAGGVVLLTWWRAHQANQAAQSAASTTTDTADTADSLDAGTLSTLETEILALQGRASVPGPAGPTGPAGPKGPAGPGAPAPPPPAKPPTGPTVRKYTVKPGDSLWAIAQKYYGNGALYPRIFQANKKGTRRADGTQGMITNPSLIQPGWSLIIP